MKEGLGCMQIIHRVIVTQQRQSEDEEIKQVYVYAIAEPRFKSSSLSLCKGDLAYPVM